MGTAGKFIQTAVAQSPDGYVYFWGTQGGTAYRHSSPYLLRKQSASMDQAGRMEYLAGFDAAQNPTWADSESGAFPLFANHKDGDATPTRCMGELGVEWNPFVQRWVMLYNCLNESPTTLPGIQMRMAVDPWGPWSAPQTIFNASRDNGLCYFIHRAATPRHPACHQLSGPDREADQGGDYRPYFLAGSTTGDQAQGSSTFYYTIDTLNPYGEVIEQSSIQTSSPAPPEHGAPGGAGGAGGTSNCAVTHKPCLLQ